MPPARSPPSPCTCRHPLLFLPAPTTKAPLDEVYRHIERARSWATEGEYAAAKQTYERVLRQINRSVRGLADSTLRARWLQCATALAEECELVNACEKECEALRASTSSARSLDDDGSDSSASGSATSKAAAHRASLQVQQQGDQEQVSELPAGVPLAMEFDFSPSTRSTPSKAAASRLVRTWVAATTHTAAPPANTDPDVWPDPPPREDGASSGPGPGSRQRSRAADRLRDAERRASGASAGTASQLPAARRACGGASGAGGGGGAPLAVVRAKVNSGAMRARSASLAPGATGTPEAKCAVLDAVLSRFGGLAEAELVEQLGRDLLDASPGVAWADVAGLGAAKQVLRDHVSLPLAMPGVYGGGLLRPARGVLLFGPPGAREGSTRHRACVAGPLHAAQHSAAATAPPAPPP